jgi:1,4-dihydroxy-2-naphthoyl-CoA synthase
MLFLVPARESARAHENILYTGENGVAHIVISRPQVLNVLATPCDLTLASDEASFGQVGPKLGSVDPGFGTAYLTRALSGELESHAGVQDLCRRFCSSKTTRASERARPRSWP